MNVLTIYFRNVNAEIALHCSDEDAETILDELHENYNRTTLLRLGTEDGQSCLVRPSDISAVVYWGGR